MNLEELVTRKSVDGLLPFAGRILVALSGGMDSVVLLHRLLQLGYDLACAHANFQLRESEAKRDEEFARYCAAQMGISFHDRVFPTQQYARERGISVEMAARDLRYQWFQELCDQYGYSTIAIGHHQEDHLETFFLNLLRGTGWRGLCGIPAVRNNIVRPLLAVPKKLVREYAQRHQLAYVEDSTNTDTLYRRNFIRHRLFPLLEEYDSGFRSTLSRTMQNVADTQQIVEEVFEKWGEKYLHSTPEGIKLDKEGFTRIPYGQTFLFEWLVGYGFSRSDVEDVLQWKESSTVGKRIESSSLMELINERDSLLLRKQEEADREEQITIASLPSSPVSFGQYSLSFECLPKEQVSEFGDGKTVAVIDRDKITFPVQVRRWRIGDKMQPFGLNGTKKVSDLLTNTKVAPHRRKQQCVMECNGTIVWLVGYRISHEVRITPQTKTCLRLLLL